MGQSCWKAPLWVRAFWCVWCLLFALTALGVGVAAVVGIAKGEALGDAIFLLVVLAPFRYIAVKAALRIGQTGVTIGGDGWWSSDPCARAAWCSARRTRSELRYWGANSLRWGPSRPVTRRLISTWIPPRAGGRSDVMTSSRGGRPPRPSLPPALAGMSPNIDDARTGRAGAQSCPTTLSCYKARPTVAQSRRS